MVVHPAGRGHDKAEVDGAAGPETDGEGDPTSPAEKREAKTGDQDAGTGAGVDRGGVVEGTEAGDFRGLGLVIAEGLPGGIPSEVQTGLAEIAGVGWKSMLEEAVALAHV